ncbi:AI-2E family transporter [Arthrobacter pityocampae]|uniref:AI-2E family transporter n=1 Tax=Arthrobacter pityocampae TaxID=547334 RepID=A0A2S5IVN6_9MICC|nr:AI-2E family transporter [Arthrobacter pityocampae]PPB48642.1 AI-2E family transporter [Arthrobacter pityocampae]
MEPDGGPAHVPAGPAEPSTPKPSTPEPPRVRTPTLFGIGFRVTGGVLTAILLAFVLFSLRSVVLSVCAALFLALGLNPLVHRLRRAGLRKNSAVAVIGVAVALLAAGLVAVLVPFVVTQLAAFAQALPEAIRGLTEDEWFQRIDGRTGGALTGALQSAGQSLVTPASLTTIANGVVGAGVGAANVVASMIFIAILTLYFLAGLPRIKHGFYALLPASRRRTSVYLTERIADSVGKYLSGMVVLALLNATYSLILLTLTGVPFAALISIAAFFITLIPLIGTILTTIVMTLAALLDSLTAAIIVLIAMLIYMQIEAYILTPRVMTKAVQVPGAWVLIAATAGGALLGLPGALVAIPTAAACRLLVDNLVVPLRRIQ